MPGGILDLYYASGGQALRGAPGTISRPFADLLRWEAAMINGSHEAPDGNR